MYITRKDSDKMQEIIAEFMSTYEENKDLTNKQNKLITELFTYLDKIIKGIIYSPLYRYFNFAEEADLMSEARISLYKSIIKKQWKEFIPKKNPDGTETMVKGASFFSFCSTVIAKNLYSYTKKLNKHKDFKADQELDTELVDRTDHYDDDLDSKMLITQVFCELRTHFDGKENFVELTNLLETYFYNNIGKKKFFKKHFTEFCKSKCFSPSLVNSYLNYLKNVKAAKDLFFYKDN